MNYQRYSIPDPTKTETIIKAMLILADDIVTDDGVANQAMRQAAARLEEQAKEIERLKKVAHEFCDEIHEKAIEIERLNDSMHKINQWLEAYPVDLFPEPDLEKAHKVLKENGINLGAISASNFRHIIKGIKELTE